MNGLDLAIAALIGVFLVVGLFRGLIRLVFAVLSIVVAIFMAGMFFEQGTRVTGSFLDNPSLAAVVSFAMILVLVLIAMAVIARVVTRVFEYAGLGWLNRMGGAALGVAFALLIVGVMFLLINLAGLEQARVVAGAEFAPTGFRIAGFLSGVFPERVQDVLRKSREDINQAKESATSVSEGMKKVDEFSKDVEKKIEDLSKDAQEKADI